MPRQARRRAGGKVGCSARQRLTRGGMWGCVHVQRRDWARIHGLAGAAARRRIVPPRFCMRVCLDRAQPLLLLVNSARDRLEGAQQARSRQDLTPPSWGHDARRRRPATHPASLTLLPITRLRRRALRLALAPEMGVDYGKGRWRRDPGPRAMCRRHRPARRHTFTGWQLPV